jgi:pSer/pThr/pTyr-binding forkhead associated (FHA) protein
MSNTKTEWIAHLKPVPSPGEADQSSYPLPTDAAVTLGREACTILINGSQYPAVSRHHADISTLGNGDQIQWQLCDRNAANGTYINGDRLQGCQILQSGDRITLSKDGAEFLFECQQIVSTQSAEPTSPPVVTPQPEDSPAQTVTIPTTPVTHPAARSLWDLAADTSLVLAGHTEAIRAIAFSSDGEMLASASSDKTIKLWNLNTGEELRTIAGHKQSISAIAFSPDGQALASGGADKTIKLWNLTGEELTTLSGHSRGITAIRFALDGKTLASGSEDKTVKLWELASGESTQTFSGHKMVVTAVAFSSDGRRLASGGADRLVHLWQINATEPTLLPLKASACTLLFNPDDTVLAIACDDKTIKLWSLQHQQEIRTIPSQPWQVGGVAISPDGQRIASGCEDYRIKVWAV